MKMVAMGTDLNHTTGGTELRLHCFYGNVTMVICSNVDITWRKRCNMSACSHLYDSHYVQLSGGGSVTSDSSHGNM